MHSFREIILYIIKDNKVKSRNKISSQTSRMNRNKDLIKTTVYVCMNI